MFVLILENHKPNFHGRELDLETRLFANKEMILRLIHRFEKFFIEPSLCIRHHVKALDALSLFIFKKNL